MEGNNANKKGLVYTISIFLIVAVLLELAIAWMEYNDRRLLYAQPQPDGEAMLYKMNELSQMGMQAMGLDARLERNETNLTIFVADAGFPFVDSSLGRVQVSPLKAWGEGAWSSATSSGLSMDVSVPNSTGLLLSTLSGKLNYSHDNGPIAQDRALLAVPSSTQPYIVRLNITCARPPNASSVVYADWANGGGSLTGSAGFYDEGGGLHESIALFSPSADNEFNATYLDGDGAYIAAIHAQWQSNWTLAIWDEVNQSYSTPMSKSAITCSWNVTATMADSPAAPETLYVPIDISLTFGSANYSGPLVLQRK